VEGEQGGRIVPRLSRKGARYHRARCWWPWAGPCQLCCLWDSLVAPWWIRGTGWRGCGARCDHSANQWPSKKRTTGENRLIT